MRRGKIPIAEPPISFFDDTRKFEIQEVSLQERPDATFSRACRYGDISVLREIKERQDRNFGPKHFKAYININTEYPSLYGTHIAAENGKDEVLEFLYENGAHLFLPGGFDGDSALHFASVKNHAKCVQVILRFANKLWPSASLIWLANTHEENSIFANIPKDIIGVISIHLSRLCPNFRELVNYENKKKQTALYVAIKANSTSVLPYLISPISAGGLSELMGAPLHFAASYGCGEACRLLLCIGEDINEQNHRDETPIFRACCAYPEADNCVREILKFNPNLELCNHEGKTALDMARARKYEKIIKLIEEYQQELSKK